jgi:splicing factor 3B subunit 2
VTESEEEESEDEEEDEEDLITSGHAPDEGLRTPSGMETPSGMQTAISTVPGGLETPDFLQLRKDAGPAESEVSATPVPRELYQVIPERQTSSRGFMGSSTTYDVAGLGAGGSGGPRVLGQDDRGTKVSNVSAVPVRVQQADDILTYCSHQRKAGVEMAVDPDDLEGLSQEELRSRYDASKSQSNRVHVPGADVDRREFDDVIAQAKKSRTSERGRGGDRDRREKEKFKF